MLWGWASTGPHAHSPKHPSPALHRRKGWKGSTNPATPTPCRPMSTHLGPVQVAIASAAIPPLGWAGAQGRCLAIIGNEDGFSLFVAPAITNSMTPHRTA